MTCQHHWFVIGNGATCLNCYAHRVLPPPQEVKGCDRDDELHALFPLRARVVRGWLNWPHTREEIRAIRLFLEHGDVALLPEVYR